MATAFRHVNYFRTILSRVPRICTQVHWSKTSHSSLHTRPRVVNAQCVLLRLSNTHKLRASQHPPVWLYGITSIRTNVTDTTQPAASGYIPDAPPIPLPPETASDVTEVLNALGEPTLSSLGLCAWTPPGLLQSLLEMFHVTAGLPWWGSIVCMTVCLRLLVFPLVIAAQRNMSSMHNHMPTIQRLNKKFSDARASGNKMEAHRWAFELQDYIKRNNVKMFRNMLIPMAQVPVFLSVFIGVRKMASLPVESMCTGGTLWFVDLTIPDPFWALPVMTSLTLLATLEMGTDGVNTASVTPIMKMVMRAMPFILLPVMLNFPTALCTYWFSSNVFSLIQCMILKIPAVRAYFNIPQRVQHEKSAVEKKKGFVEGFKDSMSNSKLVAEMENREQIEAQRFKKAGTAPIQKTYKYNPKDRERAQVKSKG